MRMSKKTAVISKNAGPIDSTPACGFELVAMGVQHTGTYGDPRGP
jgi:hypothetical protein